MTVCTKCGQVNPDGARFCNACAAALAESAPAREQRKTVTVLFCDVTGSTALGASMDPEALRAALARYFERMKGIVERHGGTVEKFIGDAVMAVFGVPQVHEDDALRAARAALEMQEALPALGVAARIGLNTGEVVTGTTERLVTGDAVNVAARLEQAAQPADILMGEETLRLIRDCVEVERIEPLELKGKAEPVAAYRLLGVQEPQDRPHATTFVGRGHELETLLLAWRRACDEERCELATVVGEPGVGKSRLAAEFLTAIRARVLRGRCLSYGEGITYWPVVEVLKQLGALPTDPAAAAPLRSLLGESEQGTTAEEIGWAFRKLLEEQARAQPVVCAFEDIQWGEDTFLDLVEHVTLLAGGAPLLLLCTARPELLDRRSQWPVTLRLEPLRGAEVGALMSESIAPELRERIARASGGNPLFVTEMLSMVREAEGDIAVPPNLRALLAARLDQLETAERSVLEQGAVEGEIFHLGAVRALAGDGEVTPRLASLVRKELLRPDKPQLPGEDAFRFRHILIRDAAYEGLPKSTRAELHERFADWLGSRGGQLVEADEILGYHLEQAARFKAELGARDEQLDERAGERLAAAGQRALGRGDRRAASSLLERALTLLRPIRFDPSLELDLGHSLGNLERAIAVAEAMAERAHTAGDAGHEALARACAASARVQLRGATRDEAEQFARAALPLLERDGDHGGLVHAYIVLGGVADFDCRYDQWAHAAEQALYHSRLAGRSSSQLFGLGVALRRGPRPADEALRLLDALRPESPHPRLLLNRAHLVAMLGRVDEAWSIAARAIEGLRELTGDGDDALTAEIYQLAGEYEAAARSMRRYCDVLEREGRLAVLSTHAPWLGRFLCIIGRYDEAEPLAERGRDLGDEQDVWTQAIWRQVQALVDAARGDAASAEELAREAVAITESTDALNLQAEALCDLGAVYAAGGKAPEAAAALEQALERYERKKNLAMVAQVRPRLEALRQTAS